MDTPITRRLTHVPRLWPGETIVCIGSGPSLLQSDVDYCRGRARVLVVNNAYTAAPWADVLFAADYKWWRWQQDVPDRQLPPLRFSLHPFAQQFRPSVCVLNYTGHDGLEPCPTAVRTGEHSGYAAINIAVHLTSGPKIVLLGYDLCSGPNGEHHFHDDHPDESHLRYAHRVGVYHTLIQPLKQHGITVINASRRTAITAFPCLPLDVALAA